MPGLSPMQDPHLRVAFRPEVPDVVVWRFDVVRDLLEHRGLSWRFADLAFERALLTLETALRFRHRELHGTPVSPASPGLQMLYRWAVDTGVVDMNRPFDASEVRLRPRPRTLAVGRCRTFDASEVRLRRPQRRKPCPA